MYRSDTKSKRVKVIKPLINKNIDTYLCVLGYLICGVNKGKA